MTVEYLKKAPLTAESDASDTNKIVQTILDEIEAGGDEKALEYAAKFDKYDGPVLLTDEDIAAASAQVPDRLKRDIDFAHANVKRFAEAQRSTLQDVEVEIVPGLVAGQRTIPVSAAGCYVPGGRYSHIASAIMTVTTAKVAAAIISLPARHHVQASASTQPSSTPPTNAAPTKSSPWAVSKAWQP